MLNLKFQGSRRWPLVAPAGLGKGMVDWLGKVRLILLVIRSNIILSIAIMLKYFPPGPLKYTSAETLSLAILFLHFHVKFGLIYE